MDIAFKDKLYAVCLIVSVCLLANVSHAKSLEDYRQSGVTVTASGTWPPYSFVGTDGKPSGYFIDFWTLWSQKTGVPVSFKLVPWQETIEMIASGEGDIQSGLYYSVERSKRFGFSAPVFFGEAVLVVGKGTTCDDDLTAVTWGGVSGSIEAEYPAKHHPDAKLVLFENSYAMFSALAANEIQAAVEGWSTAMTLKRQDELNGGITICRTVSRQDLLAMVLKGRDDLIQVIDSGLADISPKERDALVNLWFVEREPDAPWWKGTTLLIVLLCGILGLGCILFVFRSRGKAN